MRPDRAGQALDRLALACVALVFVATGFTIWTAFLSAPPELGGFRVRILLNFSLPALVFLALAILVLVVPDKSRLWAGMLLGIGVLGLFSAILPYFVYGSDGPGWNGVPRIAGSLFILASGGIALRIRPPESSSSVDSPAAVDSLDAPPPAG